MGISEILKEKRLSDQNKLKQIIEIIAKNRESYGNTELDISMPDVYTVDGALPLSTLSDESKLTIVEQEVAHLRIQAYEFVEATQGAVIDKHVEFLISTNPILTNIGSSKGFGSL